MIKTSVWVSFQKEGVHKYPAAASDPKLAAVSFLANEHRHIFHFRIELEVFHDDREVEFILLKRELEGLYTTGTLQLNNMSCEMIARELLTYIHETYHGRDCTISVSEDNENGCNLVYEKDMTLSPGTSKIDVTKAQLADWK